MATISTFIPNWLLIVWIMFHCIGLFVNIFSMAFLACFRKTPIVAMAQPKLLMIMLIGILSFEIAAIFLTLPSLPNANSRFSIGMDVSCDLYEWFWFLGHCTVHAILICKLYRTYKVVQFRRGQKILARHVFGPFALILSVPMGVLLAKQILFPTRVEELKSEVTGETIQVCDFGRTHGQLTFYLSQQLIYFLLTLSVMAFACKLRNVDEEIGDTRRIISLCVLNIITYAAFGTSFLTIEHFRNDLGEVFTFQVEMLAFALLDFYHMVSSPMVLVFPRIYYVWYERTYGELPENVQMYGAGRVRVEIVTKKKRPEELACTAELTMDNDDSNRVYEREERLDV